MSKAAKRRIALREKDMSALREELTALQREHFNLRMQKAVQQTTKTDELRRVRRDIARAKTIMGEKIAAGATQTVASEPQPEAQEARKEEQ